MPISTIDNFMPLRTLKKIADFEIKESTKQLVDYINDINHQDKNKLNLFYLKSPEKLEFLVSEIMIFYYIFGFSLSKQLNEPFLLSFITLLKSDSLYKEVFKVYSDIIEIEDINPHLTIAQIKSKKEKILEIKQQICL